MGTAVHEDTLDLLQAPPDSNALATGTAQPTMFVTALQDGKVMTVQKKLTLTSQQSIRKGLERLKASVQSNEIRLLTRQLSLEDLLALS